MSFPGLDPVIFRDLTLTFLLMSLTLMFYLVYRVSKKIKETKIVSATTGLAIYLSTFGIFLLLTSLPTFYPSILPIMIISSFNIPSIQFLGGMIAFILLLEIDYVSENINLEKKKLKYPLSLISIILIGVTLPFIATEFIFISFIAIVFPFVVASYLFLQRFQSLEIVKRAKPAPWFFVGLSISGFSNFLFTQTLSALFGYYIIFIRAGCVLIGCLMIVRGWNRIPNLSELDWMQKMEQLIVLHVETSSLLYQYNFQTVDSSETAGDLTGSAIGGISSLLKEVLSSTSNLKEIDHGNKKIIFSHGIATACILISSAHSEEFRYRLEMFQLSFEKQFGIEKLKNWDGEVSLFSKTSDLILEYFL